MDVCLNCQEAFAKRFGKGYQKSNLNRKIRLSGADSNKNITAYNALQELSSYEVVEVEKLSQANDDMLCLFTPKPLSRCCGIEAAGKTIAQTLHATGRF